MLLGTYVFTVSAVLVQGSRLPSFTLLKDRSKLDQASPSVGIRFPDGHTDTLVLKPFTSPSDRSTHCNYIGHLLKDRDACVAMTGCLDSTDDLEFTILSSHLAPQSSSMFKWKRSKDNPSILEVEEIVGDELSERAEMGETDDGDLEIISPQIAQAEKAIEKACMEGDANCASLPATQNMEIMLGYDDGVFERTGGTQDAEGVLTAVMAHTQANFCHKSLGTKIKISRLGTKYYKGERFQPGGPDMGKVVRFAKADMNGTDIMIFYGADYKGESKSGVAFGSTICKRRYWNAVGMVRWRPSPANLARTTSHEIGHVLGMRHDWAKRHMDAGCDRKGFLSYKPHLNRWSQCSVRDFQAHYNNFKDNWCMEELDSDPCVGVEQPPMNILPDCTPNQVPPTFATNCCSPTHQCAEDQGDCDNDEDCQGDLWCGSNNCPLGFPGKYDCCTSTTKPDCTLNTPLSRDCCTKGLNGPCKENQGDCDKDEECEGDLVCGKNCPEGFPSGYHCCEKPGN